MAFEFKLPDLGEGIHEAQVISVLISEGDTVTEDQPIMEVETDKAAVEIPVPRAGRVEKLLVKTGDTIKVGQVLVVIAEGAAGSAPAAKAERVAAPAAAPQRAAAQAAGSGGDGSTRTAVAAPTRIVAPPPPIPVEPAIQRAGPIPATPAVRRMAREMNIDIRTVVGSGPGGRVLQEDLERVKQGGGRATAAPPASSARAEAPRATATPTAAPAGEVMPDFSQWGPITREPVSQIRKTIARQMARSWQMVPRVTHGDEADLTELEAFRKEHAARIAEAGGGKLTITAFILKALAATLKQHPKLNCSYDDQANEIVWKHYVHIGVAVDAPRGLIVPVLRDVDRKSLVDITRELGELSARIRETKFDIAELRGGTFTLSNVGALGGTFSTPMVNYPETAILVTGRLAKKPVVRDDRIVARAMMPLSLSFDHRIIDGADAARFTKTLIELLENPALLLMSI